MITLGTTPQECLDRINSMGGSSTEEQRHIWEHLGHPLHTFVRFLANEQCMMLSETFPGGPIYIVEGKEDLNTMMDNFLPNFADPVTEENSGFDIAMYLDKERTLAAVGNCTNNGGGSIFILHSALGFWKNVPEHIVHSLDFLEGHFEVEPEIQRVLAELEKINASN